MKTKKLLKRLKSFLSEEGRKKDAELDRLEELVEKLGRREAKLEAKLDEAKGAGKERTEKKLKVVRAHHKKGQMALEELRASVAED